MKKKRIAIERASEIGVGKEEIFKPEREKEWETGCSW
jgi:hypothetical protein